VARETIDKSESAFFSIWTGLSIERWLALRVARQKMKSGDFDFEDRSICFQHEEHGVGARELAYRQRKNTL